MIKKFIKKVVKYQNEIILISSVLGVIIMALQLVVAIITLF